MNPTSLRFRRPAGAALAAVSLALALALAAALAAVADAHPHAKRHAPATRRLTAPRPVQHRSPAHRSGATTVAARNAHNAALLGRAVAHRAVVHAHMAGDPAVSIVDFSFSPGTTTIHVGDTITWTNTGKQPHSATADNHSFDTGILPTGHSGSHTFTTAGTFTYFCSVHPFMHGTVVVLAATTTTTTNTTATTTPTATAATTPTTTTTSTGATLPLTGFDELAAFAIGFLFVGGGFVLRLRARPASEET